MDDKKIPIFQLEYDQSFKEKFYAHCDEIFDVGFLSNHLKVKEFEDAFATLTSSKKALAVSSGTAAIEVVLRALDVRGKEVLLPSNTFVATIVAVLNAGGIPKLLDIDKETFSIDLELLRKNLSKKTGAVVWVHIGGLISPKISEAVALCEERGVPLVEDSAHALGSTYKSKQAGTFGVAGCFSFFTTKVLTTGEGGGVTTQDSKLFELMKSVRQFGQDPGNSISYVREGANLKMSEFHAALGLLDLERVESRIKKRQDIAARYQENLKGSSWKAVSALGGGTCSHYKQIVISPVEKTTVEEHFKKHNVALTGEVYRIPIHRQPFYKERFKSESFPNSDWFSASHICPPCYPELELSEIDAICNLMLALKQ